VDNYRQADQKLPFVQKTLKHATDNEQVRCLKQFGCKTLLFYYELVVELKVLNLF
jgi:hypothetical protein